MKKRIIEWLIKRWLPGYRLTDRKLRKDAGIKKNSQKEGDNEHIQKSN